MQHDARHRADAQLVKELIGCPVAVQARDPRFAGEYVQGAAERLQLAIERHLAAPSRPNSLTKAVCPIRARKVAGSKLLWLLARPGWLPTPQTIRSSWRCMRRARLGKRAGGREDDGARAAQLVWRDTNVNVGVQIQRRQGGSHGKSSSSSVMARSQMSRAAAVL